MKKRILSLLTAFSLCLSLGVYAPAQAADTSNEFAPVSSSNVGKNNYEAWSSPVTSYVYDNGTGFTRVECVNDQVIVEEYSDDFQLLNSRTLEMELPIWGGFFAGKKYNFLFFGQNNMEEDNQVEVIRIVKYSKDWERLEQTSTTGKNNHFYGVNTQTPFAFGSLRCAESDGVLYVRTCHRMYKSEDGLNHQANMTIALEQENMGLISSTYLVAGSQYGYVSHSFNQFILVDQGKSIVSLDQGDRYPRGFVLNANRKLEKLNVYASEPISLNVVAFPETKVYQYTGASAGGLAETTSGYIVSYNQDPAGNASDIRNVYLSFVPRDYTESTVLKTNCLTNTGTVNTTPILAPASLDGGWVLWEEKGENTYTLCYAPYYADGTAGVVTRVNGPRLSDCQPVPYGDGVMWYVTDNSIPTFYVLDASGVHSYATASDMENSNASSWAKAEVKEAMTSHLVPVDLQKNYTANITRLDFCRLMVTLIEQASGKGIDAYLSDKQLVVRNPFTDTDSAAILAAHALDIVNGTTDTTFNPNGSITRQEAAAMLSRTAKVLNLSSGSGETFTDTVEAPAWAKEGISFISGLADPRMGKKVMGGTGAGVFSPLSNYSREQAYMTALRLLNCAGGGQIPVHLRVAGKVNQKTTDKTATSSYGTTTIDGKVVTLPIQKRETIYGTPTDYIYSAFPEPYAVEYWILEVINGRTIRFSGMSEVWGWIDQATYPCISAILNDEYLLDWDVCAVGERFICGVPFEIDLTLTDNNMAQVKEKYRQGIPVKLEYTSSALFRDDDPYSVQISSSRYDPKIYIVPDGEGIKLLAEEPEETYKVWEALTIQYE